MRIVIDLQGAQTGSARRGIGRYALALTRALLRHGCEHDIVVALSGLYPDSIASVKSALAGLLPSEQIVVWNAPFPIDHGLTANDWRREAGELMREAFLAQLHPDVVLVSSLFEGFNENALVSVHKFDPHTPTCLILYDLIPYIYPKIFLSYPPIDRWYREKIDYLKRSDLLLSISESARAEGIAHLGLVPDQVANISSAADPVFRKLAESELVKPSDYGIERQFILSTGGQEERKNIKRLVEAYALLPADQRATHQLVIYGCKSAYDIVAVREWAREFGVSDTDLILLDHISDEDLIALLNACSLFVFPSWHEGFGLPALEAMQCGAPTLASNSSSLPEVVGWEEALFDPHDAAAIARKMSQVIEEPEFRNELSRRGLIQAGRFSWDESAKRALSRLEEFHASRERKPHRSINQIYHDLIERIGTLEFANAEPTLDDLKICAEAIASNNASARACRTRQDLPQKLDWRIEGPFDSSYSLALVNRSLARALNELGHEVALHSTEGPGDFEPKADYLRMHGDLAEMHARAARTAPDASHVVSRNLYPPRVADMTGQFNLLHSFAWEEGGFPSEWVDDFNFYLDGLTCLSGHVEKIMLDHGVSLPLTVSGCGVDHWEAVQADESYKLEAKSFRFLHVSSCFPRKGADVLLQAYGDAFTAADDVSLIIKTFANPHNEVHQWLEQARADRNDFPNVVILEDDLSDEELKALYERCHVLVAPSRAEGFGLPMAEAMLSGLPVITTNWSGQLDFCTADNSWLVDYDFELARTHFALAGSVWANPRRDDLAASMKAAFEAGEQKRKAMALNGRRRLLETFRWRDVGERLEASVRSINGRAPQGAPNIGWLSSWNTRCGIAAYSAHLIANMDAVPHIFASHPYNEEVKDDGENVSRCWLQGESDDLAELASEIARRNIDVLVIQFNYGFFNFDHFRRLLEKLHATGVRTIITLHATVDPDHVQWVSDKKLKRLKDELSRCDRLLVHSVADLNRLKAIGLVDNVALFPHGVLDYASAPTQMSDKNEFLIASYGFFLPHKGLLELLQAFARLRAGHQDARLLMMNAEYPDPVSAQLIQAARNTIAELDLASSVELVPDFLPDDESLRRLAQADLIVFPYQETGESSSAAVRYGLAAGKPVAVTPLSIFDDVSEAAHRLPGCGIEDLANGLETLKATITTGADDHVRIAQQAENWRKAHRYSALGHRLEGMMSAIFQRSRLTASEDKHSPGERGLHAGDEAVA